MVTTLGDPDDAHWNVGVDFRYLEQFIQEEYTISQFGAPFDSFGDNMPTSWMLNPGTFVDWSRPLTDNWTATLGAGRLRLHESQGERFARQHRAPRRQ